MTLYQSKGPLRYSQDTDGLFKLNVAVDPGLVDFYRALIPARVNRQRYAPHITVVRREVPTHMEAWGKFESEEVEFAYSNHVHCGTVYWWLNVFSKRLEDIRLELGLAAFGELSRPPDGSECFHVTLGNNKRR